MPRQRLLLLAVFILSGFAGLIYQSIWSHYIGLFLGHAAYAQALVLALFMGGMAMGAAWIAKAGQRWRNLIRGYASIELAIGVLGLLFHVIFLGLTDFSYDVLIPAAGAPWLINLTKWTVAALLILPQTILLGMTFPLMSGGIIRRFPGQDGNTLGGLYFTNSIGAAFGALTTTFVLLPKVGLPGATVTAGILNIIVALLAGWLARTPEPVPTKPATEHGSSTLDNPLLRLVLFGTALSGAASFVYEIVWIRMLSLAVGSTLHAFELMLTAFIAGIAFGGLWIRKRADRTAEPLRLVGWMQVLMGLAALASLLVYANAFEWVGWLIHALAKSDGGYALFNLGTAVIAIAIMLPAAFFAGTTLPLFTVILLRAGHGERAIGRVYAWNTLGSIVGVFAAIHLLIPMIGLKLALCVAALVDMAIGLVLLRWQVDNHAAMRRFAFAGLLAAVSMGLALTQVKFDPLQLASGVFRSGVTTLGVQRKVLFYRDGKTASVSLFASPDGTLSIATNGKVDASVNLIDTQTPSSDEATMALLAAVPLALHREPKRVGVIGFGSGMTTHTLLADPRIERVDTVEIERVMVEAARGFGERVRNAFDDPRSHIVIDDAKSYFAGQKHKYDLIVSEPSNPWISGVGALFSREFYDFVPRYLNEGGLFVQWVQLYEIDERLISSILNALTPAFSDYEAWLANDADLIIVATPTGKLPEADLPILFAGPMQDELRRIGLEHPEQLARHKIADARTLRALGRLYAHPANSDYLPILSLQAPQTRFKGDSASGIAMLPIYGSRLQEALGFRDTLPFTIASSRSSDFRSNVIDRQARSIAALLRGIPQEKSEAASPGNREIETTILLKAAFSDCTALESETGAQHASMLLYRAAESTIPFLPSELLEGVWITPAWHDCASLSDDARQIFDLLTAASARDYPSMQALSLAWLRNDDRGKAWRIFDEFALSTVLLAMAHQARWQDVGTLEDELGKEVKLKDSRAQLHALLLALTSDE